MDGTMIIIGESGLFENEPTAPAEQAHTTHVTPHRSGSEKPTQRIFGESGLLENEPTVLPEVVLIFLGMAHCTLQAVL